MASKFEWIKLFSENYIKPLLSNKKFMAFIMCAFLGTGAYTAYDLTGNKLQSSTPVVKKVVEDVPEYPTMVEPQVIKHTEKVLQPIVNCNGDAQVMRNHVKEHH